MLTEQDLKPILLESDPKPVELELSRTAIIVVDMQNAFANRGGMYDLWVHDVSNESKIVEPIARIIGAARAKRCHVVYTAHRYSPDLHEMGGPNSFECCKCREVYDYISHPEWRDKFLARGTWGAEIVEELKPQEGDIVVEKSRKSAFFETNLDSILRILNLKYLIFTGLATNVCVESTIRDAAFRGYFPILVSDATASFGPSYIQAATIFNVKLCFGWVTTTDKIMKALS